MDDIPIIILFYFLKTKNKEKGINKRTTKRCVPRSFLFFSFLVGGRPCCFSSSHLHKLGEWRHTAQPALLYNIFHKRTTLSQAAVVYIPATFVSGRGPCGLVCPGDVSSFTSPRQQQRQAAAKGSSSSSWKSCTTNQKRDSALFLYLSHIYTYTLYVYVCVCVSFSIPPPKKKWLNIFFFSVLSADIDVCGSASSHNNNNNNSPPSKQ